LADDLGLYLLISVTDDSIAVPTDSTGTGGDRLCLFFDKVSSDSLFRDINYACLIGDCRNQVGYNSMVLGISPEGPTGLVYVSVSYYDDNLWSWQTRHLSQDSLLRQFDIEVDIVRVSRYRWDMEIHIPWHRYCKGLTVGTVLGGPMAFSIGYDDIDSSDTAAGMLRWLNFDPYELPYRCFWGDLYINPLSAPTSPVSALPASSARPVQAPGALWRTYDLLGRIEFQNNAGIRLREPNTPRSAPALRIQLP
jgi:hypothetical protein